MAWRVKALASEPHNLSLIHRICMVGENRLDVGSEGDGVHKDMWYRGLGVWEADVALK